jgi:hypothetical protein
MEAGYGAAELGRRAASLIREALKDKNRVIDGEDGERRGAGAPVAAIAASISASVRGAGPDFATASRPSARRIRKQSERSPPVSRLN